MLTLTSFNVRTAALCNLYDEYGLTYDNLGQELYNIVKNPNTEGLYLSAALEDIKTMVEEVASDLPLPLLFQEFLVLVQEVKCKLSMIRISSSRLAGIEIQNNDTLVLIYNLPKTHEQTLCIRPHGLRSIVPPLSVGHRNQ